MTKAWRGLFVGVLLLAAGAGTSGCYMELGGPASESPDADVAAQQAALTDPGESEALRLQMAADRRAKTLSTLKNILKKSSDTQQTIIQNIR